MSWFVAVDDLDCLVNRLAYFGEDPERNPSLTACSRMKGFRSPSVGLGIDS